LDWQWLLLHELLAFCGECVELQLVVEGSFLVAQGGSGYQTVLAFIHIGGERQKGCGLAGVGQHCWQGG